MSDFPYLPLYVNDYLGDTRHLTNEMHGAYLLLLMEAWRRKDCRLPDDDELLARLSGFTPHKWKTAKKTVMDFWHLSDDYWYNNKLIEVRKNQETKREKKSRAGKASARKRKENISTPVQQETQQKANTDPNANATEHPTDGQQTHNPYKPPYPLSEETSRLGDQIFEAVDQEFRRRWPNDPTPRDARLIAAECQDFATEGATPEIVVDAIKPKLGARSSPPGSLSGYSGDVIATTRRWISLKRWFDRGATGPSPWQDFWGPAPSKDRLDKFEIPEKYQTDAGASPPFLERRANS